MAIETETTKLPIKDLHDVLGRVEKVYLKTTSIKTLADVKTAFAADFKLPVLDESVTFNMGDADVTRVKLIDQTNWVSYAKKGDPDISFQVPSFSSAIADVLGNKVSGATGDSEGYTLQGYTATPKKVSGALLYMSEDASIVVLLPNVEIFATPVLGDGDNPSYFNCIVTPLPDDSGADYYIGRKTDAGAGA